MRNNDDNKELFDEVYIELLKIYEYLNNRITSLVANQVTAVALKSIVKDYLIKYDILEFMEYFEERLDDMIVTREYLTHSTHNLIIKQLRRSVPPEAIFEKL